MSSTQIVRETANGPQLAFEKLPLPEPQAGQALVKIEFTAQNPTDVQSFDSNAFGDGAVLGCDFVASVGQYAIQLAKLSGIEVITVCSPKHFDFVKRLGATHVMDYRAEDVVEQIKRAVPDLIYIFDTIGSKDSSRMASHAVGGAGGTLCTVRPGKANTEEVADGVTVTDVLVWTAFLKEHSYGKFYWPPSEPDHALAAELFEKLPTWLESKSFVPNNAHVLEGLESVPQGFEMHRKGEISGFKIVYKI
ncbi:Zinc-type alcohol dehydrogenase-like protein [Lasiodiplodia theobromae]|uniref:Zinc-type alcohol dehydrogenase-like protein n=1 Tax=Lasiodiplodia theobromae TaxID=45133 RepID=A0A5N5DAC6_9PEZI|nr:Zinc-type alcohol dehydrogenase-like protein [Lasiodiplodia theobromae]